LFIFEIVRWSLYGLLFAALMTFCGYSLIANHTPNPQRDVVLVLLVVVFAALIALCLVRIYRNWRVGRRRP
jgi:membrane protein DedA with SNARE-associated domain